DVPPRVLPVEPARRGRRRCAPVHHGPRLLHHPGLSGGRARDPRHDVDRDEHPHDAQLAHGLGPLRGSPRHDPPLPHPVLRAPSARPGVRGRTALSSLRLAMAVAGGFVLLFLLAPVLALIPMSFSGTRWLVLPPSDLSFRWYAEFLTNRDWREA